MFNTPKDASDSQINSLFEIAQAITAEHVERLKADPSLADRLDRGGLEAVMRYAETLGPLARSTRIIDLQQRYLIDVEREPTLNRQRSYVARDTLSFDPDPEAKKHIEGRGDSPQAAVLNLLEQLQDLRDATTERGAMLQRAERQVLADARAIKAASDRQAMLDAIEQWDPDWRDHYGTFEAAEANYARAIERVMDEPL